MRYAASPRRRGPREGGAAVVSIVAALLAAASASAKSATTESASTESPSANSATAMPALGDAALSCRPGASRMAEVDLYFGAAGRPGAWRRFVAQVVTPRFPDGLTTLQGRGQWRGSNGLVVERTHVLVIYYRPNATSEERIEAIRGTYKRRFRQSSVLRADKDACVSF